MKKSPTIIPGTRYGHLITTGVYVPGYIDGNKRIQAKVECKCDCGNITYKALNNLSNGKHKSCGLKCILCGIRKHSQSVLNNNDGSKEYKAWENMKSRCKYIKSRNYKDYGGRGIIVSKEFEESFEAFYEYIGKAPTPKHSLDRINNDKGYERGNLRWATTSEQNYNKRTISKKQQELESIKNENYYLRSLLQENNIQFEMPASL